MRIESTRSRSVASPFHSSTGPAAGGPHDSIGSSIDTPPEAAPHRSWASRLGAAALGVTALAGGLGVMAASAPPAQAYTVSQTCTEGVYNPLRIQDTALLGHMATLFASPNTAFNHAAGLYDGSHFFSPAGDYNRLDGYQAYKQLSCDQAVRFFSPQTGWLTFHSLDHLHAYVAQHGQPWDVPGGYSDQYSAHYGDPWYDQSTVPYNTYQYNTWATPTWNYIPPPPSYNPLNQAPADPDGPIVTPGGGWSQTPTPMPAPSWNQQTPGSNWNQTTPGGNWNQGGASAGQAPADF